MAAGRGEFYRNLASALWKTETPLPQSTERGKPGPEEKVKYTARASHRRSAAAKHEYSKKLPKDILKHPQPERNILEMLPYEILLKIVSYLDATSLYYLSRVNKQFCHLANDDLLWHKIYMTRFGVTRPWWMDYPKPRVIPGHSSTGFWKQKYFKALVEQELNYWRLARKDVNPHTGLPKQTERVLRNLNVTWHLRVQDYYGQEVTLEPSKVYFFETSIIVRWSNERLPFFNQISRLELHGLKKETHPDRKPQWHSLMLRQDRMDHPKMIGKDRLIKVLFISPGFIVGILRGQKVIVFIMVCLHFHKLVERSLFGSPVSPYFEPTVRWPADSSDPQFGLHGYSLHFVLHNTGAEIMSEYFPDISCHSVAKGSMVLGVIYKNHLSRHQSLSGNIRLPWKIDELEGSIENCCIMTLTLLDEFQKPFWCVSAPITITRSKRPLSFNYSGDHFFMNFHHPEGQVKMKLVWLHEEKQFFLIDLTLLVTIHKVNKYFCTNY
ncbi:F-box only protein 15 [Periophthalmus magnuspinnatus]|uniref:F-box only protein 15 n=1 Tax=Periophthalmus magnuspinnatus TaxID=409849 RepID=UPI002436BDCF|nr:F-box only protein 15 [Periophthalmus magnuspinnatus]